MLVKVLSNNQCTEILLDSTDGKSLEDTIEFQSPFVTNSTQLVSYCLPINSAISYINQSDQIPANYSIDIVNPPPDTL